MQHVLKAYKVNHFAGADSVVEANPALVVGVLASGQDILVAHVVWSLIDHPGPALHPGGVTTTQVGVEVRAVAVAFIPATLEVLVLIEDDLEDGTQVLLLYYSFCLVLNAYLAIKCLSVQHPSSRRETGNQKPQFCNSHYITRKFLSI